MASLTTNQTNGHRRLLVVMGEKRITIRLGKMPIKDARSFQGHIEKLVSAKLYGTSIPDETALWLSNRDPVIRGKLERAGIVDPIQAKPIPEKPIIWLGEFIQGYIGKRADIKRTTYLSLDVSYKRIIKHFGADRDIESITEQDAYDFKQAMLRWGLAENSARRSIAIARQFFRAAVRGRLLSINPFDGIPATLKENRARHIFLNQEDSETVLGACPDAQWRLLFSLCRWGGLRNPSETLRLRWEDIDWDRNRIHISSSKTEHHSGHESRIIPLFPELRGPLMESYNQAAPGTVYVISRYRDTTANLRTQFKRILKRAGLKEWPKLFQNLRSTRETELAAKFPIHVVCAWMGNSVLIAKKSYLQIRDEDFEAAISGDKKAAHFPAQLAQKTAQNIALGTEREKIVSRDFISQVLMDSGLIRNILASSILDIVDRNRGDRT